MQFKQVHKIVFEKIIISNMEDELVSKKYYKNYTNPFQLPK